VSDPKIVGEVDAETVDALHEMEEAILYAADDAMTSFGAKPELRMTQVSAGIFETRDGRAFELLIRCEKPKE
jgi:hypothetical protein